MSSSAEPFTTRRMLAAAQIALSLVLLVGALLFTGSFRNLLHVDTGFDTYNVLTADFRFARATPLKTPVPDYQRALMERVAAIPGVMSVADSTVLPLSGNSWSNTVWREGTSPAESINGSWMRISPGYFRTLGIHLTAGRDFDRHDTSQSPNVAIVSQEFARRVMKADAPIGQRFRIEGHALDARNCLRNRRGSRQHQSTAVCGRRCTLCSTCRWRKIPRRARQAIN